MVQKIYVVVGPTASGKSKLALLMAQKINGEIINADSLQVYAGLTCLSARPDESETRLVKHHLYGYLDNFQTCSMVDWLQKAATIVPHVACPIFVGGTGLYINALIDGVSPIPDVDPTIREQVRIMPLAEVQQQVQNCFFTDSQRLRRALEVQLTTGKPLSYFQNLPKIKMIHADFEVFFLNPPRPILYERCDKRLSNMIQTGAQEEVKALLAQQASGGVLRAIGVSEITAYLKKEISFEQMIDKAQTATRHYAKRQVTWFRHQLKSAKILTDAVLEDVF